MENNNYHYMPKSSEFRPLMLLFLFLCLIFPSSALALDEGTLTVYRDNERKFSFHYPKSWKKVETTYQDTRFKIVSNNGKGAEDCAVNVKYDKNLEGVSSRYYMENIALVWLKAMPDKMKSISPDWRVIESGETSISNRDAYYYIATGTSRTLDYKVKISNYVIQTVKDGYVYTIGCRCSENKFKKKLPEFKRIIAGFVFHN